MNHSSIIIKTLNFSTLVGFFVIIAIFGFAILTHDGNDSNVKNSKASSVEPADINGDGKVDAADLSMVLFNWNTTNSTADLNQDGAVSALDLSLLLSKWGPVVTASQSPRTISPGARLPINYDLSSLSGTKRYVATNGNDTTGNGSVGAPYATIKKAESVAANGDTIIVRGGTYGAAANATTIDRSNLTIIAYPGETPILDGSIAAPTSTTTEATLKYFSYQPVPAGVGKGVVLANLPSATFSGTTPTGQAAERGWRCVTGSTTYTAHTIPTTADPDGCGTNPAKVITGYYPDQVWVNGAALVQVLEKNLVAPGKFWLDRTDATDAVPGMTNLYLSATDAADMTKVRVSSSKDTIFLLSAANVKIAGIKILNNSPIWSKDTVILNNNFGIIENVVLESNTSNALSVSRGNTLTTLATGNTIKNTTITRSSWTGMGLYYNDDTTLDSVLINYTEPHLEFYNSPQRGAIKATKSDRTRILNSAFENNGMGVWFDQSNYLTEIAGNRFIGNNDSAVFYEISHGLTLANNYINGKGSSLGATIRLAGASGLKIVNNTIIGGKDTIWVGTDARSKKFTTSTGQVRDCSEHTIRYGQGGDALADCWIGYTSDYDVARPGAYSPTGATNLTPGMTWFNSFDMFVNNVIADSIGSNQCGAVVPLCVNGYINWNSPNGLVHQQVNLKEMFSSSMVMNGNIYQSSSGKIAMVRADGSVSQPGGFTAADIAAIRGASGLGSTYYGLSVESKGMSAATGLVDAQGVVMSSVDHTNAFAVPVDAVINQYIPAGTKHYGIIE